MGSEFTMIAKTFKGLEEVLAGEIAAIGGNDIELGRRAVTFTGDMSVLYRANLWLRTASRVLVPIASFRAGDADEVYQEVKQIDWEQYMDLATTFSIDATVYSETFKHSRYVTYKVKDAIADRFNEKYGKRPSVRVTEPDLYINVHIADRTVTVSLDSSGESLHKRGWRVANTEAPINEALAAGMLLLAGWNGQSDLYDPMCGSGTILIEAALIALNIPPGIFRKHFAFENWKDFNKDLFETVSEDDSDEREFTHHIYGSDAGFYAVQAAMKNIRSAGVQKYVDVKQIRIEEIDRSAQRQKAADTERAKTTDGALVVINPPYGERLGQDKNIMDLYANIGKALKFQFTGATAWIISGNEEALKCIGLKPSKKIHLLNGEIECLYNQYELFQGERRVRLAALADAAERHETHSSLRSPHPNRPVVSGIPKSKKHYDRQPDTNKRVRLSAGGRPHREVPARGKRPQQAPRLSRRTGQRG